VRSSIPPSANGSAHSLPVPLLQLRVYDASVRPAFELLGRIDEEALQFFVDHLEEEGVDDQE
jgi:hypothetical protein